MSYYRRRSYGGYRKKSSSGGRVRRTLKVSLTTSGATLVTSAVAIPVDSTRNVGINIHDFLVEYSAFDTAWAGGEDICVWLNRNTPTVERTIADIDCICKDSLEAYGAFAAGACIEEKIREHHYSPPIPIFQDEIRACTIGHANTAVTTISIEVAYTLAWMTVGQIIGVAKNIII